MLVSGNEAGDGDDETGLLKSPVVGVHAPFKNTSHDFYAVGPDSEIRQSDWGLYTYVTWGRSTRPVCLVCEDFRKKHCRHMPSDKVQHTHHQPT